MAIRCCLAIMLFGLQVIGPALAQERHATGLRFLEDEAYRSIPLAAPPLLGDIPSSADLSTFFPEPGDQGQQGSCVAWAVGYALKSYQEGVERNWSLKDKKNLFSPSFIYNQIKVAGCEGGSHFRDAFNLLRRDGVVSLSDFPYDPDECSSLPNAALRQQGRTFSIAEWRRVNAQDEVEVKTQLASNFPVLIGMEVDQEFMDLSLGEIYGARGSKGFGGHAMVVVGYDDDRAAFKVINSWGRNWGDEGFGWIGYNAFAAKVREAYVVQDIVSRRPVPRDDENPRPPPQPAPSVTIGTPILMHNVPVTIPAAPNVPYGMTAPGLQITVPGRITGAGGQTVSLIASFRFPNGQPLFANPIEAKYRDVSGWVAAATDPVSLGSDDERTDSLSLTLPYYALNFPPTNGMNSYSIQFSITAMLNNRQVGQSAPQNFMFRW